MTRTCVNGHPFIPENRRTNGRGKTRCRPCYAMSIALNHRQVCRTPQGRFMASFAIGDSGCWDWQKAVSSEGYALMSAYGQDYAHRISHLMFKGPIPDGLTIDHLCRNRRCVNPTHLEAVTMGENLRRAHTKTHCLRGHAFDEANSYIRPGNGHRMCLACQKLRQSATYRQAVAA